MRFRTILAAALAVGCAGAPALASNNPNGIVFRAVGFWKGRASISNGTITCEVPSISSKISDGAFSMGLWNTFGVPTLLFPDRNSAFGDPCGGYLELQSNLVDQSIVLDRVEMKLTIPGAGRFRARGVRTFRGFPVQCMPLRRATFYVGEVLGPSNSTDPGGSSGAPNVVFIQMLPLLDTEVIQCLRSQYAPLPSTAFASLPVVIRVTAVGISDSGQTYRSNSISYALNMRHTCGNGRVDDGEECDATAPGNTCGGACTGGTCTNNPNLGCQSNADCIGTCNAPGGTSECTCLF
jgi:hypothetical protein